MIEAFLFGCDITLRLLRLLRLHRFSSRLFPCEIRKQQELSDMKIHVVEICRAKQQQKAV